jgi:hypothetical protein
MKAMNKRTTQCLSLVALTSFHAIADNRDVQFANILVDDHVLMIFNSGAEAVSLDGWRFCTQNSTQTLVYTPASGLNGVSIPPSSSITIHLNNDANAGVSTQINASDIGSFANFELTAYSLAIYFPNSSGSVSFGDGNLMADFLQWSLGGLDNTTADERSDEAEVGGVWVDQSEWINVRNDSLLIELTDPSFAELHSPENYNIIVNCPADLTDDGMLNFFDVSAFLGAFSSMDPAADFTGDGLFNFFDVSAFLGLFIAGCP